MKMIHKILGVLVLAVLVLGMNGCATSPNNTQNPVGYKESSMITTETAPAEEQIAQETPAEEQIAQETPAEEQIAQVPSTEEQPVQEESTEEQITQNAEQEEIRKQSSEAEELQQAGDAEEVISDLSVHFIDVGQGDCTLLICDGEAMLIDAGNKDKGTTVQLYLKKQGVTSLKYVVGTHPDADHIGGLNVILYKYDCETIIMPDKSNDTAIYRSVMDTIANKNYKITYPVAETEYMLGDARVIILGPGKTYSDDNNSSVVIKVVHGEKAFLFTGDIEIDAETDLIKSRLDITADVLQISHHGSRNATGETFLKKVNPTFAVISCEEGNSYGHPHAEVLNRLRTAGCQVYRTDEQGSLIATSDGREITWNCAPSDSWKAGEPTGTQQETVVPIVPGDETAKDNPDTEAPTTRYILNINTMKFHYPECSSVKDIKDKNKRESTQDRDTLISQGYAPCKRCKP